MHSESLSDYEDTLIEYDMTSNVEENVDQIEAIIILDEFEQAAVEGVSVVKRRYRAVKGESLSAFAVFALAAALGTYFAGYARQIRGASIADRLRHRDKLVAESASVGENQISERLKYRSSAFHSISSVKVLLSGGTAPARYSGGVPCCFLSYIQRPRVFLRRCTYPLRASQQYKTDYGIAVSWEQRSGR